MNDKASPALIERLVKPGSGKFYLIGAALVLAAIIAYLAFGRSAPPRDDKPRGDGGGVREDDPIQSARVALSKSADLNSCRDVVAQVNRYLARQSARATSPLTRAEQEFLDGMTEAERQRLFEQSLPATAKDLPPDQARTQAFRFWFLKQHFQLDEGELAEVDNNTFTLLDGRHFDACFLMRDAASAITVGGPDAPLSRALAAFAWTVRHVRLRGALNREPEPAPPEFVLRRGWGSALERALVFMALLSQLDLPGCLVAVPGAGKGDFPLWTCGVLVGVKIYLFDPRMGMPLSGPNGEGVTTLADVQDQPDLLKQLTVDKDHGYDVDAEQARTAEVYLACPLSALAPRQRYLEKLLEDPDTPAPRIKCRLAVDAVEMLGKFEAALNGSGKNDRPPVRVCTLATRQARRFFPPAEGGIDKTERMQQFLRSVIPLSLLPRPLAQMQGAPRDYVITQFGQPLFNLLLEPRQAHDLELRGRFNEASTALTARRKEALEQLDRYRKTDNKAQLVSEWPAKAYQAYRDLQDGKESGRQAVAEVCKEIEVVVDGLAAGPRGAEATYWLVVCQHEQAERLQAQIEAARRAGKAPTAEELAAAQNAWRNAAEWWDTFLQEHADARFVAGAAARAQAAHARQMLGDHTAAIDLLKDLSDLAPLEQTGRLFLAGQSRKKQ